MSVFQPYCLPTALGSLPYGDPGAACDLILSYLPEIPVWPQLPKRSPLENMYVQYFHRLPGAVLEGDRIFVDTEDHVGQGLEQLYGDYLSGNTAGYDLNPQAAAGLFEMRRQWGRLSTAPYAVKGQVTGPISGGLQVTDRHQRPILYDEVLGDAMAKYLRLVATAHERALGETAERTIVFLDEPYLSAVGSAFIQIRPSQVGELLSEVLGGLHGLTGIHCCGNTDWSLVLATHFDVLSFDAYNYLEMLMLYADDVKRFVGRNGTIAWGIVPTDERALAVEDEASLTAKLLAGVDLLASKGLDREEILASSLVTPSCGLGPMTEQGAVRALALTAAVARRIRRDYLRLE